MARLYELGRSILRLDRHAPAGLSFYAVLYLAAGLITLALYLRHSQPGAPVAE